MDNKGIQIIIFYDSNFIPNSLFRGSKNIIFFGDTLASEIANKGIVRGKLSVSLEKCFNRKDTDINRDKKISKKELQECSKNEDATQ